MAKCKTKDCVKEAAAGSKYCSACQCVRDKDHKTFTKCFLGTCVLVCVTVASLFRRSDKA